MSFCCKSQNNGKINIPKFRDYNDKIQRNNIPYSIDGDSVMICSPVGNQEKFLSSGKKADIVLSGYSTAPDAALSYIDDIDNKINYPELKNSFGTRTMQNGIREILTSLGFFDVETLLFSTLNPQITSNFNLLFTQMLCMISNNGSSNASEVDYILKNSINIRKQAEYSLEEWYERITSILKTGGVILLMGRDAENLINNSFFNDTGKIIIDFDNSRNFETLQERLIKQGYKIFNIMHAAAFQYNDNREKWLSNPNRTKTNLYLYQNFPMFVGTI